MNILLIAVLIISAILIIVFDYKFKLIPMWLLIINYSTICFLSIKWLLFGIIFILVAKKLDIPIDILYVILLCILISLTNNMIIAIVAISICLAYVVFSDQIKISFMVPLEIGILIELLYKVSSTI